MPPQPSDAISPFRLSRPSLVAASEDSFAVRTDTGVPETLAAQSCSQVSRAGGVALATRLKSLARPLDLLGESFRVGKGEAVFAGEDLVR
jgi:hypothetical protein